MNLLSLANAKESELFNIMSINIDAKMRTRLLGVGLGKGIDVGVLRNRGGDVVLGNGNTRISLGREIADKIIVKALGLAI